ncbi:hypothetical protein CBM2633_B10039 [Cupriavidus taiwanensis]|nr:hypothetical protein CBM2633_B10039 [Cupriavidus taiwanensis]
MPAAPSTRDAIEPIHHALHVRGKSPPLLRS